MQSAEEALRDSGRAMTQQQMRRKEIVYLEWRHAAYRHLLDDLWNWGIGVLRQKAAAREWGPVAVAIADRVSSVGGTASTGKCYTRISGRCGGRH